MSDDHNDGNAPRGIAWGLLFTLIACLLVVVIVAIVEVAR